MRFAYTIIYVEDVAATVAFYERAFKLQRRFVHDSGSYAEMETGSTALAFAAETAMPAGVAFSNNRAHAHPAGAEVAFVSNAVERDYSDAVAAGAAPVSPPSTKPWGQVVAYVRDLNGFLVELCSEVT